MKPLHTESTLVESKLAALRRVSTAHLLETLRPGSPNTLKTREDGTMLDGHHRVYILKQRGYNIDSLPREIIDRTKDFE